MSSSLLPGELRQIGGALCAASIPHGQLRELPPQNNLAVTDGSVFVKLSRARGTEVPAGWGATEIEAALRACALGIDTVTPRLLRPLRLQSGRLLTVWNFQPGQAANRATVAPAVMARAAAQLALLHMSPPWSGLTPGDPLGVIARRLVAAPDHPEAVRIAELAAAVRPAWAGLAGAPMVPSHGDPHAGNLILGPDGRASWCDWESVRLAPAEWDAACLQHNLAWLGGNDDAWAAIEQGSALDPKRLAICLAVKAVAAASFLLMFDDRLADMQARLDRIPGLITAMGSQKPPPRWPSTDRTKAIIRLPEVRSHT